MHRGYVKIYRKISDSGLLQMHGALATFIYMLTEAAHRPVRFGTIQLKRGQLCSGRHKLAGALGLSEQKVRTCVDYLIELEMIVAEPTNKYTLYTIVNYNNYQDNQPTDNQQITNNQPTDNQQITTIQEAKHSSIKELKDKSIVTSKLADACPHAEIIQAYHDALPTMPRVKVWTETRKKHLQARWREDAKRQNLEYWSGFFGFVAESDFLCGRTAKPFNCDLEWLIKSANFVKIIEGKYVNT